MSVASRARQEAFINKINASTPEWARIQIARQNTIIDLRTKIYRNPEQGPSLLGAALARAIALLSVVKKPHSNPIKQKAEDIRDSYMLVSTPRGARFVKAVGDR